MKKRSSAWMAVVAAVVLATTTSAYAATTYTPTGTTVSFSKSPRTSSVVLTDIEAGQTITCPQFDVGGSLSGSGTSRAYGAAAASLSTVAITGCANTLMGWMKTTAQGSWTLDVLGDSTGTSYPARVSGAEITVSMANCFLKVSGAMNGTFDTSTQTFTPVAGASGLSITDIPAPSPRYTQAMCPTLDWQEGDTFEVSGSWTNTGPALSITSP